MSDPDPHTAPDTTATTREEAPGLDVEIRALHEELALLRAHKMVVLYQSPGRVLLFKMLTGMAVGLGTVIGATVLLSLIVWSLSQIEFIPIIGEWSASLAEEIQNAIDTTE